MRNVFQRRAATAALIALVLAGVGASPAMATAPDVTQESIADSFSIPTEGPLEVTPNEEGLEPPAGDQEGGEALVLEESETADGQLGGAVDGEPLATPSAPAPAVPAGPTATPGDEAESPAAQDFDIINLEVNGLARVGQTLDTAVEFTLDPDYVEFQWFADDEPIADAVDQALTLTEDLVGKTIVVGVYAERDDFEEAIEAYSEGVGPVTTAEANAEEFQILSLTISGTAKVGQTLTSAVTFSHVPDFVGYLWFADEEMIEGAENETLVLTKDMIGKTIVLGVYALNDDFDEPAFDISNEIGPVQSAPIIVVDNAVVTTKPASKPAPKPTPMHPADTLADTGADVTGVLIGGVSLLLLGSGAVMARRRVTQN